MGELPAPFSAIVSISNIAIYVGIFKGNGSRLERHLMRLQTHNLELNLAWLPFFFGEHNASYCIKNKHIAAKT